MALVVEDGSGLANADSYAATASAVAYCQARPQDAVLTGFANESDPTKQDGALREATTYLDATWGALFIGSRKTTTQALLFPRVMRSVLDRSAYCSDADFLAAQALTDLPLYGPDGLELPGLPAQIVAATIELAARARTGRLAPDKGEEGWLKVRKVGQIQREWGAPGIAGGSIGFVDGLLAPLLIGPRSAALTGAGSAQWFFR